MLPDDRSAADERTALSWERSSLALAVVVALLVSAAHRAPWIGVPGSIVVGGVAVALAARGRLLGRRRAPQVAGVAPDWFAARALTAVTLVSVLVAAALLLSGD